MNTTTSTPVALPIETADALFSATGLSHLCENVERSEAEENNIGCWTYELESGETLVVGDDQCVTLYDTDGIGRVYSPEDLRP